jgi:hypothetical protein
VRPPEDCGTHTHGQDEGKIAQPARGRECADAVLREERDSPHRKRDARSRHAPRGHSEPQVTRQLPHAVGKESLVTAMRQERAPREREGRTWTMALMVVWRTKAALNVQGTEAISEG